MSRWTRRARLVLAISAALAITACGESLDSDNRNVAPAETGKEG